MVNFCLHYYLDDVEINEENAQTVTTVRNVYLLFNGLNVVDLWVVKGVNFNPHRRL